MEALVSSPHAGVHRQRGLPHGAAECVFPARGGSPGQATMANSSPVCLPRTRGFTASGTVLWLRLRVSSPHAGVHDFTIERDHDLIERCVSSPYAGFSTTVTSAGEAGVIPRPSPRRCEACRLTPCKRP